MNQSTGVPTIIQSLSFTACSEEDPFPRINAMDFQPGTGALFGSLNTGEGGQGAKCLVTINTTTADVTIIGLTVDALDAIAFAPPPTPTPTSTPEPTVLAATATPAPTPTVLAAQQLPTTGGTPSDGGASALPWLAAIAVMGAGGAFVAVRRRR